MVRYRGPRVKIIRRLGELPGFTQKNSQIRLKSPGQHGTLSFTKTKRTALSDDYNERLFEKQKLRFNYGITEKQLISYYKFAKRSIGPTGLILLQALESRLDCIIFRLGFALTIPAARQIINHGHICINKTPVNIPSFQCKINDIICSVNNSISQNLITTNFKAFYNNKQSVERRISRINLKTPNLFPQHLELNKEKLIGKVIMPVVRNELLVRVNELKVTEFYS
jgi:small subunit ribosomal protein S4